MSKKNYLVITRIALVHKIVKRNTVNLGYYHYYISIIGVRAHRHLVLLIENCL